MKRRFSFLRGARAAVCLLFLATMIGMPTSRGLAQGLPSYLILQAPAKTHKGKPYQNGRGYAAPAHAYSYGWFGAKPRRHWRCHVPYYANFFQWSKR
jgi:hypothetical protein